MAKNTSKTYPTILSQFKIACNSAKTAKDKGDALEELVVELFMAHKSIYGHVRNRVNALKTEEIDIAFFNNKTENGFAWMETIILVECKNWNAPVGCTEVTVFISKIKNRALKYGILVAANGITGSKDNKSSAIAKINEALRDGIKIIVTTVTELQALKKKEDLINLLIYKELELAAGTPI